MYPHLNPEQRAAVLHPPEATLLLLAAAGTGKTEVLTTRIAHMVRHHGIGPASRVLAVTFSNRAAAEMRARAARLCGVEERRLSVATFHSTAVRILRMHPECEAFTILDEADALRLVERVCADLTEAEAGHGAWRGRKQAGKQDGVRPRDVYAQLNRWRCDGLEPEAPELLGGADAAHGRVRRLAAAAYAPFREQCRRAACIDFADLLCRAVRLLRDDAAFREAVRARWTHVLVDEFQDTNLVQLDLVRLLTAGRGCLTVVGDDSQTIHEHAGADVERILTFAAAFPGTATIRLERNYRSTAGILAAANNVIRHNARRTDKRLLCTRGAGPAPELACHADEAAEAAAIAGEVAAGGRPFRDVCLLYRVNALSGVLEQALSARGVPFRVVGGRAFFERAEVRDALAHLAAVANPRCRPQVLRALGSPPRGVGPVALRRLEGFAAADAAAEQGGPRLLEAARRHLDQFSGRTLTGLKSFLAAHAAAGPPGARHASGEALGDAVAGIVQRSGLTEHLRAQGDGAERAANVEELVAAARRAALLQLPDGGTLGELLNLLHLGDAEAEAEAEAVGDAGDEAEEAGPGVVTLMSIHRSKGLEWPCVYVAGFSDGCMPFDMSLREGRLEGERRLAYVALTRARDRLVLSYPRVRMTWRGLEAVQPSRFVAEMGAGA